jgi:hypothetical protein
MFFQHVIFKKNYAKSHLGSIALLGLSKIGLSVVNKNADWGLHTKMLSQLF